MQRVGDQCSIDVEPNVIMMVRCLPHGRDSHLPQHACTTLRSPPPPHDGPARCHNRLACHHTNVDDIPPAARRAPRSPQPAIRLPLAHTTLGHYHPPPPPPSLPPLAPSPPSPPASPPPPSPPPSPPPPRPPPSQPLTTSAPRSLCARAPTKQGGPSFAPTPPPTQARTRDERWDLDMREGGYACVRLCVCACRVASVA